MARAQPGECATRQQPRQRPDRHRADQRVEHDLETLVAQRVYGLAPGDGATAAGHPYKRIVAGSAAIDAQMVALHATAPAEIVLDLDATDDPMRGHQERRFFHG